MGTVCFNIERVDDNYVCVRQCGINEFNYQYHIPLSFDPLSVKSQKTKGWYEDSEYRYMWVLVGKKEYDIEQIFFASNSKEMALQIQQQTIREESFTGYSEVRMIKIPFEKIVDREYIDEQDVWITRYQAHDLLDNVQLWCPTEVNACAHIYTGHYEEIAPIVNEAGFKERQFKWFPPETINLKG